ncbi:Uncharacterised protein [Mycobacterium tuberculosis]|nr:Uncharacterised protein [Mycobacterium tuberculosis]
MFDDTDDTDDTDDAVAADAPCDSPCKDVHGISSPTAADAAP